MDEIKDTKDPETEKSDIDEPLPAAEPQAAEEPAAIPAADILPYAEAEPEPEAPQEAETDSRYHATNELTVPGCYSPFGFDERYLL